DALEIRRDFAQWPRANVGIATGRESGIFVLEADTPAGHDVDGLAALAALEAIHGSLPSTRVAQSPSGSRHWYFNYPPNVIIRTWASQLGPGLDVRAEGGMVVAPPSVRDDGSYCWLNDGPVADAPAWLIEPVREKERAAREPLDGNGEAVAAP